jgi:hypothetical protein
MRIPLSLAHCTRRHLGRCDAALCSSCSVRRDPNLVTGLAGKVFVMEYLKQALPGFSECNWVSHTRNYCMSAEDLRMFTNDPPFDFMYWDASRELGGIPGATCLIEVKSAVRERAGWQCLNCTTNKQWMEVGHYCRVTAAPIGAGKKPDVRYEVGVCRGEGGRGAGCCT